MSIINRKEHDIFESILTNKTKKINPTIIYNEGWMVRLLVEYSIRENICLHDIHFEKFENWTSEALISSPFIKAPKLREGYTHVDIAFGDFTINYQERGELVFNSPKLFGVIEAKMKSDLSQSTSNYKNYNQASRNVACIAKNTLGCKCESYFIVVAPKSIIDRHQIEKQIDKTFIVDQINSRFNIYDDEFKKHQKQCEVLNEVKTMTILSISYEDWIAEFRDGKIKKKLESFYSECKAWNKI